MYKMIRKISDVYKPRGPEAKKYDYGHLLVIGGSKIYSGSPGLNALAAMRCGADLVTVASPERAANIVASFSPDIITYPLEGDFLSSNQLEEIRKLPGRFNACVIGGGLGRKKKTLSAVCEFLKKTEYPCVIDADAIHAIAEKPQITCGRNFLLTPNRSEFHALAGHKVELDLKLEKKAVKKAAKNYGCAILYKGTYSIVSDGNRLEAKKTGSPYMTKGGCGDLLAGVCGALLARKALCFDAGILGAYINGKAGKFAAKKLGESMLASDILDEYSSVINTGSTNLFEK